MPLSSEKLTQTKALSPPSTRVESVQMWVRIFGQAHFPSRDPGIHARTTGVSSRRGSQWEIRGCGRF